MAKASDNVFPRFLISEGGSTATPAAGNVTMYAKADGLLYSKDDAGAETLVSGGAGGGGSGEFTEVDIVNKTDAAFTTTSNTFVDVTGLSITQTTAAVRCMVIFSGVINCATASINVGVDLDIDGVRVGQDLGLVFMQMQSVNDRVPVSFVYITDVLTAASHTFKIQMRSNGTATAAMQGQTTTVPARFTVLETSMAA